MNMLSFHQFVDLVRSTFLFAPQAQGLFANVWDLVAAYRSVPPVFQIVEEGFRIY